jgi:hypothetical protein
MPNTMLSARHIKEIFRLKLEAKLSHRQIACILGIGVGTVSVYEVAVTPCRHKIVCG